MAGTAISFGNRADTANRYMTRYVLTEITDNLRDLVTDIEVLRVELNTAEDWILEVNTDLETKISATVASFNAADNADGVGEAIGTATTTGAVLGDFVQLALGVDIDDYIATGYVQAANTVDGWLQNESGGNINLADTNVQWLVEPFATSGITGTVTAAVLSASTINAASDLIAYNITFL